MMIGCLLLAAALNPAAVSIRSDKIIRSFRPDQFFGAGIDGSDEGSVERTFRSQNLRAMKSAGFQSFAYRLRTELAGEAWHWNPEGTWSDSEHQQGYWTGLDRPGARIDTTWGYRLPRRGNTFDQANDDGYSRITDGHPSTFWKSNPYLSGQPQWVVIDLGRHVSVNEMRIRWADPYAVQFRVEYWRGAEDFNEDDDNDGKWLVFPKGYRMVSRGGNERIAFGKTENVRFVRLTLLRSSGTSDSEATDLRDRAGFAIRELEAGSVRGGAFHDEIRHVARKTQTAVYVSSTDPWHRASDIDLATEQPGFDRFFGSSLVTKQPVLVAAPVLYDTPENAEAEIRWLQSRGYLLSGVEMGEEPDGQCVDPESYANLYLQVADRLKHVDPKLPLGGPGFQSVPTTYSAWPDRRPKSWMRRFVDELTRRKQLGRLDFFSFEWYPFDRPFGDPAADLKQNSALLRDAVRKLKADGLSPKIPWLMTEYGYSAFAGPNEVDLPAGLLNLDTIGQFLNLGGASAYLYGFGPGPLISDFKGQWGNLITWLADEKGDAQYPLPTHWAAQMMTSDWCQNGPGLHQLVRSGCSDASIATYAVKRADHSLAILLLNKDGRRSKTVSLNLNGKVLRVGRVVQYGPAQFAWHADGAQGRPLRSLPPERRTFAGNVTLPPFSITVVFVV